MTKLSQQEREILVKYRLEKVKTALNESELLFKNGLYSGAVNRSYYACFYAVIALFIKNDIETKTHAGVKQKLGERFIITGKLNPDLGHFFSQLFDKRHANDYDDFIDATKEEAENFLTQARVFVEAIEKLVKE